MRATEIYSETKRQFDIIQKKDVFMNSHSLHQCFSILKFSVFSSSSVLPQLGGGDGLLGIQLVRLICCQISW